jgi:hypothetical protein
MDMGINVDGLMKRRFPGRGRVAPARCVPYGDPFISIGLSVRLLGYFSDRNSTGSKTFIVRMCYPFLRLPCISHVRVQCVLMTFLI